MKPYFFILTLMLFSSLSVSQQNIYLDIEHYIGAENAKIGKAFDTPQEKKYELNRLQYYLSGFSLILNNGDTINIDNSVALINITDTKSHYLGEIADFDVKSVSKVLFYLGVDSLRNHGDPTLYSEDHPLALKIPSMHWGWTGGYNFIAWEGAIQNVNGLFQIFFEVHTVGLRNRQAIEIDGSCINIAEDGIHIHLLADYDRISDGIKLDWGLFSHSEINESKILAINFKNKVFTAATSSTDFYTADKSIAIYPNPSKDQIMIYNKEESDPILTFDLFDKLGNVVLTNNYPTNSTVDLPLLINGIYFIRLKTHSGKSLMKKLIIQK